MTDETRQSPTKTVSHATEEMERCIACGGILLDDDLVFDDVSGGTLHQRCCGPERDSYVNLDTGEPLNDGEPIPAPRRYRAEQLTSSQRSEGS
jgi:hypothetical protein